MSEKTLTKIRVKMIGILSESAASVYKLRNGKIIESEMFHDTATILKFLQN